jgi:putative DNA primase/helicase
MVNERTRQPILEDGAPLGLARAFVAAKYHSEGNNLLAHWRGEFFGFRECVYVRVEREDLRAQLYRFLDVQRVVAHRGRARQAEPVSPTARKVSEVLDALAALTQADVATMPAWLDGKTTRLRPSNLIAFTNGLLDVEQYVNEGEARLVPPSPLWFSLNVLPVRFDERSECPRWRAYLDEVLDKDPARILLLQEFMGYLLTQSTALQKLLLMIGPPRSGKGTILRVIHNVAGGEGNVVSYSLLTLAERFGLMSLVGKTVAICPDAHMGRGSDSILVLERLKSIVGEDAQMIERKHLEALPSVKLKVRFVVAVNEFPRLPDSSAAMRSRMLPLQFHNSYEGREDRTIDGQLAKETAGIIRWSLDGLRGLLNRGEFLLPDCSKDLLKRFSRLSSPVLGFVEDCCEVGPDKSVTVAAAWEAWQSWARTNGHEPGAKTTFGEHLRAAVPGLSRAKMRDDCDRVPIYRGIALTYGAGPGVPSK